MSDIRSIESSLGISLPQWYVDIYKKIIGTPGAGEIPVMLNVQNIIQLNLDYRQGLGGNPPWPKNLYFMGDDGAASCYVIDLAESDKRILLFDHGNPGRIVETISDIDSWVDEIIHDASDSKNQKKHYADVVYLFGIILVIIAAIFAYAYWA